MNRNNAPKIPNNKSPLGILKERYARGEISKQAKEIEKSIAVFPFHNYSGDPAQDYMSDGLTDEIISHLYKIESFDKVVPLDYVLKYKGTDIRPSRIADHLKAFLTGSEKQNIQKVPATNQEAYELIQQTLHLWNPRSYNSVVQLLDLGVKAIGLDPDYENG